MPFINRECKESNQGCEGSTSEYKSKHELMHKRIMAAKWIDNSTNSETIHERLNNIIHIFANINRNADLAMEIRQGHITGYAILIFIRSMFSWTYINSSMSMKSKNIS